MPKRENISMVRYPAASPLLSVSQALREKGVTRISSTELSAKLGLTASQIRQDLNCFGGFGQQGYGYMVDQLCTEIGNILGLSHAYKAVFDRRGQPGPSDRLPSLL